MSERAEVLERWPVTESAGTLELCRMSHVDGALQALVKTQFNDSFPMLDWRGALDEAERERLRTLQGGLTRDTLTLEIRDAARTIGWSFGWQLSMDSSVFYMANSAVLPGFRRRGLYRALLSRTMSVCRARGYQAVHSRHVATNNPILIAKLQAGFQIHGLEMSEIFGSLVHLRAFLNPLRAEAHRVRTGLEFPQSARVAGMFERVGEE